MAIVDEMEVRSVLNSDREKRINQAYNNAWSDWWNGKDRTKLSRWPRTRANNLFEYLANHLFDKFQDDPDSRFILERETFKLIIQEQLVVRFKKGNSNGVGSNVSTQTEMDFRDIEIDMPGLPGLQKIEIVYSLNSTETSFSEITVLARNGDKRLWGYNILGSGLTTAIPIMQPQPPTSGNVIDRMIKPKKAENQVKEEST